MHSRPVELSICIVSWNTREMLLGALESIEKSAPPATQTIVVDNASGDGSAAAVARRFPAVTLIENEANRDYAEANNQALRIASGEYVLLLNPDVVLEKETLQRAIAFLEARPSAGALGARQVHPDGTVQRSVRGFPTPAAICWELTGLGRLFPRSRLFGAYRMRWFDYDHEAEVDQPMGTFLMIRRAALADTGLLDERFPIFFNEVDWCLRCKRAGWSIWYSPDVRLLHYGGAATGQVAHLMAWESRRGLLAFYRVHYGSALQLPLRWLIAIASWPYAFLQARRRAGAAVHPA